ncbi:MAG: type II toxin-antitoxin system VapC family toxin [Verrucomicrobia bacterium]|nr:type II toxin-antitoxin system VapC family toxin [Verrucomicrobiota bacterium]
MDAEIFLDAAYLIALGQPGDQHHAKALALAETIRAQHTRVVTNRAVLLEVGSALSKLKFRLVAIQLLESIERAPSVEVVPLSEELVQAGWDMFRRRSDKEWSWADCISFVVMQERGIRQALTTDEHFQQAGFTALLR